MRPEIRGSKIHLNASYAEKEKAKELGAYWSKELRQWTLQDNLMNRFVVEIPVDDNNGPPPAMNIRTKIPLRSYQSAIASRAVCKERFGIFCEMGTGKTAVCCGILTFLHSFIRRAVIICPVSLVRIWEDELTKFVNDLHYKVFVFGNTPKTREATVEKFAEEPKPQRISVLILNYEALRKYSARIMETKPQIVIADETSKIKNRKAQCTKLAIELADQAQYVYALNGTPVSNTIEDLYSQMRFVNDGVFGRSYWQFAKRYLVFGGWNNKEIVGYQNENEINEILDMTSSRIKKSECLDLPPKVYEKRIVQLSGEQLDTYRNAEEEFIVTCQAIKKGDKRKTENTVLIRNALSRLTRCAQITGGHTKNDNGETIRFKENPKVDVLMEIVESLGKEKVVIFTRFIEEINVITERLTKAKIAWGAIHGEVENRSEIIKNFQEGHRQVIVCQIQTGGLGITLTAASVCIYFSNWYSWGIRSQSEDRLHRIGQKKSVTYIDILAENTVDESILQTVLEKKAISDLIMNGGKP